MAPLDDDVNDDEGVTCELVFDADAADDDIDDACVTDDDAIDASNCRL